MNDSKEEKSKVTPLKRIYETPKITTEELLTFGAVCNGTTSGGRKETSSPSPPPACNSSRLKS